MNQNMIEYGYIFYNFFIFIVHNTAFYPRTLARRFLSHYTESVLVDSLLQLGIRTLARWHSTNFRHFNLFTREIGFASRVVFFFVFRSAVCVCVFLFFPAVGKFGARWRTYTYISIRLRSENLEKVRTFQIHMCSSTLICLSNVNVLLNGKICQVFV